ncbi:uncharacterized protein LTR77_010864 [Saxophila tyrrhenica]|uniref:Uncharacterized protein n=1 Tax=Saxophila tyrrhenica TaxID=1690608 RepID=A0AAV9NUY8_9PEZI|nr:hypothetical protein LTR77_010864 [Saxophila tyrrhenica]
MAIECKGCPRDDHSTCLFTEERRVKLQSHLQQIYSIYPRYGSLSPSLFRTGTDPDEKAKAYAQFHSRHGPYKLILQRAEAPLRAAYAEIQEDNQEHDETKLAASISVMLGRAAECHSMASAMLRESKIWLNTLSHKNRHQIRH